MTRDKKDKVISALAKDLAKEIKVVSGFKGSDDKTDTLCWYVNVEQARHLLKFIEKGMK